MDLRFSAKRGRGGGMSERTERGDGHERSDGHERMPKGGTA
jgi:hypothetical protein